MLLWLLIPNAVAGLVISWRWTDMPDPLSPMSGTAYQRYAKKVNRGLLDTVIVLVVQFVGVVVIQLVVATGSDDWGDFFEGPLLITVIAGAPRSAGYFLAPCAATAAAPAAAASGSR